MVRVASLSSCSQAKSVSCNGGTSAHAGRFVVVVVVVSVVVVVVAVVSVVVVIVDKVLSSS